MELNQAATYQRKAFSITEQLEDGVLEAHSCGHGRFTPGTPSADFEVCFRLYRTLWSLDIQIHDENLLQWLLQISSLRADFDNNASISMWLLLPHYQEMKAKFAQNKGEGHSCDAVELFFRHFLLEGSVFASFGFENLHEEQILTELHFHDIQSGYRSMLEDLDLLDEAIGRLDEQYTDSPSHSFHLMNECFRPQLKDAVQRRDPAAVHKVLAMDSGTVDAKILCLAIRCYQPDVFRLLLQHGVQTEGDVTTEPLYRAAKTGNMEAVQLLLRYGANKEGGRFCISATPLTGAASGGHLEIVQYLVEAAGADIDGNTYKTPLSRAIKRRHMHIVDYLLMAGADVLKDDNLEYLSQIIETNRAEYDDILERCIAGKDDDVRDQLLSRAASEGHINIVKWLVTFGMDVTSTHEESPVYRAAEKGHHDVARFLLGQFSEPHPTRFAELLSIAAKCGHLDFIKHLIALGADINPPHGESPLYSAIKSGRVEVVRCLVQAGVDVNPATTRQKECPLHDTRCEDSPLRQLLFPYICIRKGGYSPLAVAAVIGSFEMTRFLSAVGAALLEGEDKMYCPEDRCSVGERLKMAKDPVCLIHGIDRSSAFNWTYERVHWPVRDCSFSATDVEDCPAVAAIRAQERRSMARRLLEKVARSREKLLDAGTGQDASASLIAYVDQIGTSASVWRSGTRAIRDISEGYMPGSLQSIVSALQVASAMRSVASSSKLVCSKNEFVNDIPRWASLLIPADQRLFFEIASHLWGDPSPTAVQEGANSFSRAGTLMLLQELVTNLVRTSGLFDHSTENSCGSYRLQTLRQKYPPVRCCTQTSETRLSLAEWRPLPTLEGEESLHSDHPKPPDPGAESGSILVHVTVFMAGAIFGAILLYLCLYRYGRLNLRLPVLVPDVVQVRASDRILARNCIILAMYMGYKSLVVSGGWESTDHSPPKPVPLSPVLPDSPPIKRGQDQVAAVQTSNESDCIMIDAPGPVDTIMEDMPADGLASLSPHLISSPSTTTHSPFTMATATPGSTTTSTSEDERVACPHCESKFTPGKSALGNLRKHIKRCHPGTEPNCGRVMYECRYRCGRRDPDPGNIKSHEQKHCPVVTGRKPRPGKYR